MAPDKTKLQVTKQNTGGIFVAGSQHEKWKCFLSFEKFHRFPILGWKISFKVQTSL